MIAADFLCKALSSQIGCVPSSFAVWGRLAVWAHGGLFAFSYFARLAPRIDRLPRLLSGVLAAHGHAATEALTNTCAHTHTHTHMQTPIPAFTRSGIHVACLHPCQHLLASLCLFVGVTFVHFTVGIVRCVYMCTCRCACSHCCLSLRTENRSRKTHVFEYRDCGVGWGGMLTFLVLRTWNISTVLGSLGSFTTLHVCTLLRSLGSFTTLNVATWSFTLGSFTAMMLKSQKNAPQVFPGFPIIKSARHCW